MAKEISIYDNVPPSFKYDAEILSPGVNLTLSGTGSEADPLKATYSDYGTTGSPSKARCVITIAYSNLTWKENSDNSITVSGNITGAVLTRTKTSTSSTEKQEITAWFNGKQTFKQTVDTYSSGTYDLNIPNQFSITIPASENPTYQYPAAIEFKNDNTTSTNPPDWFRLGLGVKNNNPTLYRPGKVIDAGDVKQSHNRTSGKADIFNGDLWSFTTMGTVGGPDANNNPPYIYHIDENRHNMRKIGENA